MVCYISNFSYLSDPSYVVMRQRFINEFDKLWFDCLNGSSRETGKKTPDGKPDPSVFSTQYNKAGIKLGTTVGLMVRKEEKQDKSIVYFRHFWGVNKRQELINSLENKEFEQQYEIIKLTRNNRFSFKATNISSNYLEWVRVSDLCYENPYKAFLEARRGALIDIDKNNLEKRMKIYYDSTVEWEKLQKLEKQITEDAARYDAKKARSKIINAESYDLNSIHRYLIRPFELRWCYHSLIRPLWNEPRPELYQQCWSGNKFIITRLKTEKKTK